MRGFLIAAIIVAAIAAFWDFKKGVIPNWVTLPPLLIAPVAHFVHAMATGATREAALIEGGSSLFGALFAALVPFVLYRQSAIGGGDLKAFAALGAICKISVGIELEMYAFILATLIAPARLAYQGKLLQTLKNAGTIGLNFFRQKEKKQPVDAEALSWFRLGPLMFVGTLLAAFLHWDSTE